MFKSSTYQEVEKGHLFSFLVCTDCICKPQDSLRARYEKNNIVPPGGGDTLFIGRSITCF